jgi:hypothetical protein
MMGFARAQPILRAFVILLELAVALDEPVELRANPIGIASGAASLLPAIVDKGRAMPLLLFCGERHMESLF